MKRTFRIVHGLRLNQSKTPFTNLKLGKSAERSIINLSLTETVQKTRGNIPPSRGIGSGRDFGDLLGLDDGTSDDGRELHELLADGSGQRGLAGIGFVELDMESLVSDLDHLASENLLALARTHREGDSIPYFDGFGDDGALCLGLSLGDSLVLGGVKLVNGLGGFLFCGQKLDQGGKVIGLDTGIALVIDDSDGFIGHDGFYDTVKLGTDFGRKALQLGFDYSGHIIYLLFLTWKGSLQSTLYSLYF